MEAKALMSQFFDLVLRPVEIYKACGYLTPILTLLHNANNSTRGGRKDSWTSYRLTNSKGILER